MTALIEADRGGFRGLTVWEQLQEDMWDKVWSSFNNKRAGKLLSGLHESFLT